MEVLVNQIQYYLIMIQDKLEDIKPQYKGFEHTLILARDSKEELTLLQVLEPKLYGQESFRSLKEEAIQDAQEIIEELKQLNILCQDLKGIKTRNNQTIIEI